MSNVHQKKLICRNDDFYVRFEKTFSSFSSTGTKKKYQREIASTLTLTFYADFQKVIKLRSAVKNEETVKSVIFQFKNYLLLNELYLNLPFFIPRSRLLLGFITEEGKSNRSQPASHTCKFLQSTVFHTTRANLETKDFRTLWNGVRRHVQKCLWLIDFRSFIKPQCCRAATGRQKSKASALIVNKSFEFEYVEAFKWHFVMRRQQVEWTQTGFAFESHKISHVGPVFTCCHTNSFYFHFYSDRILLIKTRCFRLQVTLRFVTRCWWSIIIFWLRLMDGFEKRFNFVVWEEFRENG